jgi:glycine cleavage system aminomethyltransferase T
MNEPYKLTPMHSWHTQNGAPTSVIDGWVRVLAYGDSQAEIEASHSNVGICDVTPLSKLDIQGRGSSGLLGELTGIPMPDAGGCGSFLLRGVSKPVYIARLTSDRYIVLAQPSLRDQLYRHLLDTVRTENCVHINDLTSAYAVVQLFGPKAVAVLKKLGSAPVERVQIQHCLQATSARVWSLLIHHAARQGYAWLTLVSRDFGKYVWESVLAVGQEFSIRPFGLAAARVLIGMEDIDVAAL